MDDCRQRRPPRGARGPCARRVAWSAVASIVLAGAAAVYSGCSPQTRYEVLSFFFDGVPPPEGVEGQPEKVEGAWGIRVDPDHPLAPEVPKEPPERPATVQTVFHEHEPYRQRNCFACHKPEASLTAPAAGAGLCAKCHEPYTTFGPGEWVHGPVAVRNCAFCHEAHKSEVAGLLTAEQTDLCLRCHDDPELLQRPYHARADDRRCAACHDPHSAGNRLLLVDSQTYERRGPPETPVSVHKVWKERQCQTCHLPERSNALVDDVDAKCVSCHEEALQVPAGEHKHKALEDRQCAVCHNAHTSPLPNLVRPGAEALCYECHEREEIQTDAHPPVVRADCLVCHKGHSSEREHLLRKGIGIYESSPAPEPQPDERPAPEAARGTGRQRAGSGP
ncbi:MAG: cytochrome c3 family protein [Phycisphaerae bacterium]